MSKINSAESLRGLACVAVVLSHLLGTFYPQLHSFYESTLPKFKFAEFIYNSPFAFWYSGNGAVFVFFVLSGYVLTLSSLRSSDPLKRFNISIVKRYPRLAIPALLSCMLMYAALHVDVDVSRTAEAIQKIKLENISFFDAIYNGAIGAFFTGDDSSYNRALWTMRIELAGSFIVYLACLFQSKPIVKNLFIIAIVIVSTKIPSMIMLGFFCFIIGHYFYFFNKKLPELLTIVIFVFGLYLCGAHNGSASYTLFENIFGKRTEILLNFSGGALIVFSVLNSRIIDRLLDKKPLVYLGKISFAIYLIHFTIIYIVCVPAFNLLVNNNLSFFAASMIASTITLVVIFLCSTIYSKYVDDLSINISNKIARVLVK